MPDLHKEIASKVRSKRERDKAQQFLRDLYGNAIKGTEWEMLAAELDQQADPIDPDDPIEFYELEMRGVATAWPDEGMGHAWVWQDTGRQWTYAPGLVNKSWLEGTRYGRAQFQREFPAADLDKLEALIAVVLRGQS